MFTGLGEYYCKCENVVKSLLCLQRKWLNFTVGNVGFRKRKKNVWNENGDISGSAVSILIFYFQTVHDESSSVTGVQC